MASMLDEHKQWTDTAGRPLTDGFLYVGSQGNDPVLNPITIYSDSDLTTPIANPQRLDAYGKAANKIYIPSVYSLKVTNVNSNQIEQELYNGSIPNPSFTTLTNVAGIDDITAEADPVIASYVDQQQYTFTTLSDNTGAMTLDAGPGAKSIYKKHDQDPDPADVKSGQVCTVIYNESDDAFELQSPNNPIVPIPTGQYEAVPLLALRGYLSGFELGTFAVGPSNPVVSINPGVCLDSTNSALLQLTTSVSLTTGALWVEGGPYGLFSGGMTADTWYHVFVIGSADGSSFSMGLSTSLTASDIPSGYVYYRRVLSLLVDSAGTDLVPVIQTGDHFHYEAWQSILSMAEIGTTAQTYTAHSPLGLQIPVIIHASVAGSVSANTKFTGGNTAVGTASAGDSQLITSTGSSRATSEFTLVTNTDSEIRAIQSATTGPDSEISTVGYIDKR